MYVYCSISYTQFRCNIVNLLMYSCIPPITIMLCYAKYNHYFICLIRHYYLLVFSKVVTVLYYVLQSADVTSVCIC